MQRDGQYRGVTYRVESMPAPGGAFTGSYQLLDAGRRRHDATDAFGDELEPERNLDVVHPISESAWATENEALSYATEAACHAIEILQLGRPQGQGRGTSASRRRTDSLGQ